MKKEEGGKINETLNYKSLGVIITSKSLSAHSATSSFLLTKTSVPTSIDVHILLAGGLSGSCNRATEQQMKNKCHLDIYDNYCYFSSSFESKIAGFWSLRQKLPKMQVFTMNIHAKHLKA